MFNCLIYVADSLATDVGVQRDVVFNYLIKNFNRNDEFRFFFDIANVTNDHFNITEADCLGFKIVVKDKRKASIKRKSKVVTKDKIGRHFFFSREHNAYGHVHTLVRSHECMFSLITSSSNSAYTTHARSPGRTLA